MGNAFVSSTTSSTTALRVASGHQPQLPSPPADLLFSVEADSWNCVNSGIFFARAVPLVRRFVGVWLSLLLDRPIGSDQATLYLLLGLLPGMDHGAFADREGLFVPHGGRARVLGHFQTPHWGSLGPRVHFATTFEATYVGFEEGWLADLVAFHLMESWPVASLSNPLYADVRAAGHDPVAVILEGISCGHANSSFNVGSGLSGRSSSIN